MVAGGKGLKNNMSTLSENHWRIPFFKQRITAADWRKILLDNNDKITYKGRVVDLVAKDLGYGVVEIFKDPE